ncbi:hypothetical protein JVT61DRAFT_13142 [Boletus reticuloceps]|uniref:DUF7923 domain-containing protein n=1 Tax=Boletus reticuloceps TaxID=495285 RepID=A0A8I2YYK1_9AGAM|nr:hypothetical protein JVT61DRAFT_13142 [Boletus reticuloceps]
MEGHPVRTSLFQLSSEVDALLAKEHGNVVRIDELSTNLEAFRTAYTTSQAEIKRKADEIAALLAELNALKGHQKRIICLLDGDGTIFSQDLILQGQEGGLEAARLLTENVRNFLVADIGHEKFHLWVYLFYNKRGLLETFARVGLSSARLKFDDFIIGFNQAAERFLMVDVGGSKEAADAKIKGYILAILPFHPLPHPKHVSPQFISKIIFAFPRPTKLYSEVSLFPFSISFSHLFLGSHDNGYVNALRSVITEGFRDKLILIPGYAEVALDIRALALPELRIPDLFITTKLVPLSYTAIASGPPPGLPISPRVAAQNGHISNSSTTSVTTPHAPADILSTSPRRNSIQSYKSALQAGRPDPVAYETSDSSVSTDANDAHPAQLIHFTPRMSSPGRQRRLNPKLVESVALCLYRLT